jgi:putative nucleotidyltransferase with HDIG domain
MRPALKLYVTLVVALALLPAVALVEAPALDAVPLAVALVGFATVAQLRPLHLTQKMKMTVEDSGTFAAALVLAPWLALVVAGASTLIAAARNRNAPWFETAFNTAVSAISTLTAALVFVALGGDRAAVAAHAPAAAVAAGLGYLVHGSLVDIAVGLQLRRNPLSTWWPVHRREIMQSAALYALGGLMAIVANIYPLATMLFLLPVAAVFVSMRETARLRAQTREAVLELVKLIDLRDHYTHAHSQRVSDLAVRVARRLSIDPSELELIREAALLHDLGKVRTADRVLQKPGPLDRGEWHEMRMHAEAGAELLRRLPDFWEGASLVRSHHERHDGTGYPRGLSGPEIPLAASIIAVADAWDAMTSDRPYRKALSMQEARAELVRNRGSQWSPKAVDALLAALDEEASATSGAPLNAPRHGVATTAIQPRA